MAWRRGQAYGQDLRERVLGATGLSLRAAAARFAVSPSYVAKVRTRLRRTGEATPGPQRNHVPPRLAPLAEALRARVASGSDATLAELRAWALAEHGVAVSQPVMWKALARLGLALKKTRPAKPSGRPSAPRRRDMLADHVGSGCAGFGRGVSARAGGGGRAIGPG